MLRTTGASMLVVAELEAIWEMAEVIKQSRRRIREGGRLERLERAVPTKLVRHDLLAPSAKANPPPMSRMMPHGNCFSTTLHSRRVAPDGSL